MNAENYNADARAQFEAWVESRLQYGLHKNPNGTYNWITVQEHWEGWQAALAARQPVANRRNPLLAYADSYKVMASMGDGRVSASDVAFDIEKNMVPHAAPPAQGIDLGPLRRLYQAYVRLLESGRDRIIDFGGTCDPVDVMERTDVDLIEARNLLGIRRDAAPGVG